MQEKWPPVFRQDTRPKNHLERDDDFKKHHPAYISSTEVNGTALATGVHPDRSGVIANTDYRPEFSWLSTFGTENLDAVRRGDLLSDGNYRRVKPGKRRFNLHHYFMTNPSLSGRGQALEGKAVPKLALSQRGGS